MSDSLLPQSGDTTNALLQKLVRATAAITPGVGGDPAGAAAAAIAAHVSETDPHPSYQLRSERGSPDGYPPLGPDGVVPSIYLPPVSGAGVDRQYWDTPGTYTWTNPSPTVRKRGTFRITGPGGSGGSGRKGAPGTVRCGGGGGAGGAVHHQDFWTDQMPSSVSVTVGASGAPGAAVSANGTNGNAGLVGNASIFGLYQAAPGNPGQGGTVSSGSGGSSTGNATAWYTGVTGNIAGGSAQTAGGTLDPSGSSAPVPTSGAAGGGITSANAASRGGHAQQTGSGVLGSTTQFYGGGANTGLPGDRPTAASLWGTSGRGGAGGGGSTVGNAGAGGAGRGPGGGGAGGGAATDGVGDSGAGGQGEPGAVEVIVFL